VKETTIPTDAELLLRLKANDPLALTLLFERYYQPLCRFVFVFIPDNELAEEFSANVFIRLWETRDKIVIHDNLRSYLYQSAKNQAFTHLRKKKISLISWTDGLDITEKKDQTPEAIFIDGELKAEFQQAFSKISPRAQLAFKLHRFDDLSYKEVAAVMDISVSAVEKNITSALKILHRELVGEKLLLWCVFTKL